LEVHAEAMREEPADADGPGVSKSLMAVCLLVARLPPHALSASGLPANLCARLTVFIEDKEVAFDATDCGGEAAGDEELEVTLANWLSMFPIAAIFSCVIDTDDKSHAAGVVHPAGAQAVCAAGGAAILVRLLEAASNAFGDTLPTSLHRIATHTVRDGLGFVQRRIGRMLGRADSPDAGEDACEPMMKTMIFSSVCMSAKLLSFLSDSGPAGAEAVLDAGGFDAFATIVDWYPKEQVLVDHWKDFLASLLKHQPKRQSELLVELVKEGVGDDDGTPSRPTAQMIMDHLFENHGDEVRESLDAYG
jgi:hypothetical protein